MPEEFKTTGEPLKKEQSTKVTYHGKEGDPEVDVVYGVAMKKGESVDLAEHMSPEQAQRFASKLAGNPAFEVQGTPRAKPPSGAAFQDQVAVRSAASQVVGAKAMAERQGKEPPEGYDAPLTAVLESQNAGKQQSKQEDEPASRRSAPPTGRR